MIMIHPSTDPTSSSPAWRSWWADRRPPTRPRSSWRWRDSGAPASCWLLKSEISQVNVSMKQNSAQTPTRNKIFSKSWDWQINQTEINLVFVVRDRQPPRVAGFNRARAAWQLLLLLLPPVRWAHWDSLCYSLDRFCRTYRRQQIYYHALRHYSS